MSYKNLTLLSFLALVTLGSIVGYNQFGTKKTIHNKFTSQVDSLEQQTWQSLEKVGISKDEIYKKVNEYDQMHMEYYQKNQNSPPKKKPVSARVKKLVTSLIDYFKVDAPKIDLIATSDPNLSPATAINDAIFINEEEFFSFSTDAQEYIISHELQHIINRDPFALYAVDQALLERKIELDENNPDFVSNQFSRFCETRADIGAATSKPETAHGFVEFTQELINRGDCNPGTTHPKTEKRLALAQEIYSSITQTA
jgi:Zn-dependent protease with chaperone function